MLKISKNKQTLLKDGKIFFYLADTCWSAFTNISDEEWDYYLYKKKFKVLIRFKLIFYHNGMHL